MSPAALYERQRALVRAGLLEMKPGHGPGSGVLATPHSIAMLLIALLATGSLSETESHAKILATLKSNTKRCPLTGEKTFARALAAILASQDIAKQVVLIGADRSGEKASASIGFGEPPLHPHVSFSFFGLKSGKVGSALTLESHLYLDQIIDAVWEAMK